MYEIERSEEEINDVLNKAMEGVDKGSKWPGMSYEQGVLAALDWLFGTVDFNPMED